MASFNLNDMCCICRKKLVKGSEYKEEAYKNLNDRNVEIIERFANAWKQQGSPRYNKCINVCREYKKQKWEASFHVKCYEVLLSNATYLDECKKKSQATVQGNEKDGTSAAVPSSIRNSTTTSSSFQASEIASGDRDCIPQAASIMRERILKLPNGNFKDYTDEPLVYMFFSALCTGEETTDMPLKNEELHKKILFLCQEFATAVHKHKHQESRMAVEEDLKYLAHLVMNMVIFD